MTESKLASFHARVVRLHEISTLVKPSLSPILCHAQRVTFVVLNAEDRVADGLLRLMPQEK